jgi:hypothetical protein
MGATYYQRKDRGRKGRKSFVVVVRASARGRSSIPNRTPRRWSN